jgi:hypothetical protein
VSCLGLFCRSPVRPAATSQVRVDLLRPDYANLPPYAAAFDCLGAAVLRGVVWPRLLADFAGDRWGEVITPKAMEVYWPTRLGVY